MFLTRFCLLTFNSASIFCKFSRLPSTAWRLPLSFIQPCTEYWTTNPVLQTVNTTLTNSLDRDERSKKKKGSTSNEKRSGSTEKEHRLKAGMMNQKQPENARSRDEGAGRQTVWRTSSIFLMRAWMSSQLALKFSRVWAGWEDIRVRYYRLDYRL